MLTYQSKKYLHHLAQSAFFALKSAILQRMVTFSPKKRPSPGGCSHFWPKKLPSAGGCLLFCRKSCHPLDDGRFFAKKEGITRRMAPFKSKITDCAR
jgi:hypothetical protein